MALLHLAPAWMGCVLLTLGTGGPALRAVSIQTAQRLILPPCRQPHPSHGSFFPQLVTLVKHAVSQGCLGSF